MWCFREGSTVVNHDVIFTSPVHTMEVELVSAVLNKMSRLGSIYMGMEKIKVSAIPVVLVNPEIGKLPV